MDMELVGFDTETTGVSPVDSRLVTASIVTWSDPPVSTNWLANPGVPIPHAASQVHGISTERARAEGRPIKDVLVEVRDTLGRHFASGGAVVAFNAAFDFTLLEAELTRHGQTTLSELLGSEPSPIIDPLVLDRFVDKYRKGPRRLESMCEHYGVDASGFHDAQADVLATLRLWEKMKEAHTFLRVTSLDKLHEIQKESHAAWATSFNAYLASKGRRADADGKWPLGDLRHPTPPPRG